MRYDGMFVLRKWLRCERRLGFEMRIICVEILFGRESFRVLNGRRFAILAGNINEEGPWVRWYVGSWFVVRWMEEDEDIRLLK